MLGKKLGLGSGLMVQILRIHSHGADFDREKPAASSSHTIRDGQGSVGPGTDGPASVVSGTDGPGSVVIPRAVRTGCASTEAINTTVPLPNREG